ncbi:1,6-anhydro-N-acetylmuramyl-L-alanine amidase AmpD [Hahella sp. SMD15-11]|uniref:1,6-anhydro-N-acetylmuramyl-L-alanine amidase AmpD n=1 Tax=Thermohahella caldifontis TaxID=3142973 RepID=A0AB39UZ34_9GAMM
MNRTITPAGWLVPARRILSPNFNARPDPDDISLVVLHNISLPPGQFGGRDVHRLFTNTLDCSSCEAYAALRGVCVSAHLFIDRAGEVTQFVPFSLRAWHAGVSSYDGRDNCNDFSIGIELEGTDTTPYTDRQYKELADVLQHLLSHYPRLNAGRITGHSDVAPGRKTDPGPAFDWQRLHQLLGERP